MKPDFKEAISKVQKLNPTAAVFARAHHLISSQNAELEELANIIKMDTALTAEIIRLSNSSSMGGPVATGNLRDAMARVGLAEVDRFLGLSLSKSVMNRDLECYGVTAYAYWSCSVSTAIIMELLAKRLNLNRGEAYTLGILHAVGRLVINQVLNDLRMTIYWDGKMPIDQWEIESVGFTYSTAGALLLRGWGFPQETCDIIENQLSPESLAHPQPLLKLLNFAIQLLLVTGATFSVRDSAMPTSHPYLQETGITNDELKTIVQSAQRKHADAVVSLGIAQ